MSAHVLSFSQTEPEKPWAVSFRFLLSLYAIVPLCVLVLWFDRIGFDDALRQALPSSPGHFLLFQVLFGTPHIIASNLLLLHHRDYLATFKTRLLGMSAFIVLVFGIGSLFIPYTVLYIISAIWTVYHVLKQQHGIAKAVCRLPPWAFYMQMWLSVLAGVFIYLGIFLKNTLTPEQAEWMLTLATLFTALLVAATLVNQRQVPGAFGRYFLWANTLLVVASFYVYSQHYYFLAILMPRLVHDITAYSFYVTHDVNRHGNAPQAMPYRLAAACRLSPAWVLPVLSLLLTVVLQVHGDAVINWITLTLFDVKLYKAATLGIIGYLALMHYYTESFIWSAGSPLRRYIRFGT
ncbi:MAG: hypothetical protein KGZ80_03340 [Methylomonas sp.]|nr:hypothetical protein [Methylomonas sp.]PPD21324.1 MAG: hypothetical protein CTY23_05895 [Methylomonas sp.]PPD26933.1 MAG: hypothetical protein CTY22_03615 [Methylomonas sp.]PPD38865.1 MAG: hypothetical protein CTY21_03615 [Methylomonas sp.]PPD41701.1 MAG: hypothetical protein CTY17_03210 [Methylomonas sp.]